MAVLSLSGSQLLGCSLEYSCTFFTRKLAFRMQSRIQLYSLYQEVSYYDVVQNIAVLSLAGSQLLGCSLEYSCTFFTRKLAIMMQSRIQRTFFTRKLAIRMQSRVYLYFLYQEVSYQDVLVQNVAVLSLPGNQLLGLVQNIAVLSLPRSQLLGCSLEYSCTFFSRNLAIRMQSRI